MLTREIELDTAINDLLLLTTCRCDECWTSRNLHSPDCLIDYREPVDIIIREIKSLEDQLDKC